MSRLCEDAHLGLEPAIPLLSPKTLEELEPQTADLLNNKSQSCADL